MAHVLKIVTHSGGFHCDEAMACAMLKQLPKYKDAEIIRTRDAAIIDTGDIVVDVGATYEPEKNRFDHHQRSFTQTLGDCVASLKSEKWANRTKLSSAGLVYAHFGHEVLKVLTKNESDKNCAEYQTNLYKFVYENLMEEVDAVDNGIDQYSGDNLVRNYKTSTSLSSRVSRLMPDWLEQLESGKGQEENDKYFPIAMEITLAELKDRVRGFHQFWAARDMVLEAVKSRFDVHESGKVIHLKQFCPWKKHLYLFEEDNNFKGLSKGEVLYCVFGGSDSYRVQCVSANENSFENRKSLPEKWRGIRNKELAALTGLDDAVFVHASGFI